jgi:hypothetical protein
MRSTHRKVCVYIFCIGAMPSDLVFFPCAHLCICKRDSWHARQIRAATSCRYAIVVLRPLYGVKDARSQRCAFISVVLVTCFLFSSSRLLASLTTNKVVRALKKVLDCHAIAVSERYTWCMQDAPRKVHVRNSCLRASRLILYICSCLQRRLEACLPKSSAPFHKHAVYFRRASAWCVGPAHTSVRVRSC